MDKTKMYGNGSNGTSAVFSQRTLSKAQRAILGAKIKDGQLDLGLTNKQFAAKIGVSVTYLAAAEKLSANEQQAVWDGWRPLIRPKARLVPGPQERLAAIVDEIGLDRVLNLLNSFELTNAAAA
jgi:DNA-binding transcriptional regulator YiaG